MILKLAELPSVEKVFGIPKVLWCYWAGGPMTEGRKKSFQYLIDHVGLPVILVEPGCLRSLILKEHPLHPCFPYLSAVHQSDYIRTYIWHHYGGAWHDVKATKTDISPVWKEFADPKTYFVGKPEHPNGTAKVHDDEGRWMPDYWKELVSVIAWVGRPYTAFSGAMYMAMHSYLDNYLDALKTNPGKHPREKSIMKGNLLLYGFKKLSYYFSGRDTRYPLPWTLFGNLFHPLNYKYREHIKRTLPTDLIKNAGIYHR
ncbi:hypothetical protein [Negadavirga shengliensis]|uniref:Capsular polysaccharide synthesis protein n=1 Tax=Negadavirga shengliensis TaxID=1389218 RepID=A0ABV9T1V6_9BACT